MLLGRTAGMVLRLSLMCLLTRLIKLSPYDVVTKHPRNTNLSAGKGENERRRIYRGFGFHSLTGLVFRCNSLVILVSVNILMPS